MKFEHLLKAASLGVAISVSLAAGAAAQGGPPANIGDLPPGLQDRIRSLPPTAQGRALGLLGGMPKADYAYIHIGNQGYVAYVDPPPADIEEAEEAPVAPSGITSAEVFTLHSKPGASKTLFLDFDGHTLQGTLWNTNYTGLSTIVIDAWDPTGDGPSFNQNEVDRIAEAWKRVSEDFAPFDVDVTTEDPGYVTPRNPANPRDFGPDVGHALITTGSNPIYDSCRCGGVAYLFNFGDPEGQTSFTFNAGLSSNAMTVSHETGHTLGLHHDGGGGDGGYYRGHGSGATGWGPIMGAPFGYSVVTWSNGSYPNANNLEDDYGIIDNYLPLRLDDHEDVNLGLATPLVASGGAVSSTGRVTDPSRLAIDNEGIIGSPSDIDLFSMNISAGLIDLDIRNDLVEAFAGSQGADLDIEVNLLNEFGDVVQTSNPDGSLDASITYNAPVAGTYYLEITGVGRPFFTDVNGNPTDGYADYGIIGHYFISGAIPPDFEVTDPPVAPTYLDALLVGENNIALDWDDPNSGASSEAGYRLYRSVNGATMTLYQSLPANMVSFDDNNLSTGEYAYEVEAWNSVASGITTDPTDPIVIDIPVTAVATSESTSLGSVQSGSYASTQQASGAETLVEEHSGGRPSGRVSSLDHTWFVTGVQPGSTVELEVAASAPSNSEGDDFAFSYSDDGGDSWTPLGTIVNGSGDTLAKMLPADTSGTVQVRVVDTDRNQGGRWTDTVTVSRITITSAGEPGDMPPTIAITEPSGDVAIETGEAIVLGGTASDPEDGPMTAAIQWTSDVEGGLGSGDSVAPVLSNPSNPTIHTITASVTDSAGTTSEDTVQVTVADPSAPPSASISSPGDGETFTAGDPVSFSGTASDPEEGDVTASLVWTSSRDEEIGTGGGFSTSSLTVGAHTITATATDSGGATGSDSISITIEAGAGPNGLSASGYKNKGRHTIDLTWTPSTSTNVDVVRNGSVIATTANDGAYTDATDNRGGASYTYQVCEAGTSTCSNSVIVTF